MVNTLKKPPSHRSDLTLTLKIPFFFLFWDTRFVERRYTDIKQLHYKTLLHSPELNPPLSIQISKSAMKDQFTPSIKGIILSSKSQSSFLNLTHDVKSIKFKLTVR